MDLNRIACFPTNEQGRGILAQFQEQNVVTQISAGEFVNNGKKEPCLWVLYVKPIAEIPDEVENIANMKPSKKTKIPDK